MSEHNLKTWPSPFLALATGLKQFEYRKDGERNFQVGDTLRLFEYVPERRDADGGWASGYYTGKLCVRLVTYVLHGPAFGIPEGYSVMSLSGNGCFDKIVSDKDRL